MKRQKKYKSTMPHWYKIETCPVCGAKSFEYCSYSEEMWGTVEQHGNCLRCGYFVDQAYSNPVFGIRDTKRGFYMYGAKKFYHAKDVKRHKRIRRKLGITGNKIEINKPWMWMI